MTGMQRLSFGVTLFSLLPIYIHAVTLTFTSKPGLLNYVKLGDTLRLDVSYDFDGTTDVTVAWEFGNVEKVKKVGNGGVQTLDSRATIEGEASLVLKNTILKDNITFTVKISSLGVTAIQSSFQVIITVRPTAKATCSGEGDTASCLCEGKGGNPPAKTTWLKGNTKIKGPEDLSTTMDKDDIISNKEGVYTCKANSANLTHEASVTLSKPKDISFKSETENGKTKLVCKVVGTITPAPVYLISFNGSEAKEYKNGEKYLGKVDSSNIGQYECLAKNVLGNATKHLFLNVAEPTTHTTTPSVEITTKEREKLISDKGTEWYVSLITFICGMIVGMVLLYAIMWFRLRLSKKGDHSKPPQPGAVAGPSGEGLENASAYQELDLQKMNKGDDNYQSLRMTSRNARSNTAPVEIENEAGYQELNEVRGNADDNYQPLNRV